MRLWFLYLTILLLLVPAAGCQTLQKRDKASRSILGLKRGNSNNTLADEALDPLGARDGNRLLLDDLSFDQIATTFKTRTFGRVNEQLARENYAKGIRLYREASDLKASGANHQETFVEAASQFRLASSQWPDSEIEEDALYHEGESFFFADHYVQANRAFEKLIGTYSGTRYLDRAEQRRFTAAIYWLELSEQYNGPKWDVKRPRNNPAAEARRVLHRIQIDDPTGKLADDAALALGKAFLQNKRYYEAAESFEDLRRNYPGSEHQFTAHMLELEAHLAGYQGKSYDDTPLKKADNLMKSILRQFPTQAKDQLSYLEDQAGRIRHQLAERDYSLGQYFERRGENRAAGIYYQQVAENFQGTEFASDVTGKITEVAALPPVPEQHAKWLVDLFPEDIDEKPLIKAGNNGSIIR